MSLTEILAEVVQSITDIIPRIGGRPARNEWLVIDRWFKGPVTSENPVVYIPVATHLEYYPKVKHPVDPGLQTITTADGKNVVVNVAAVVVIDDPLLLREHFDSESWEAGVSLIIRSAVSDAYSGHNFSHCVDSGTNLVNDSIDESLSEIGVELQFLCIEDRCEVIPLRHFAAATEVAL